ncbi:MAG: hypothetical protein A3I06_15300 [Candidatus Lindowbacteria bacterium RIFCSPLOWO2_02_FULL_62_12]|nr:MAG: hypothetical protein A3I06_15300 [Candidatus Lindowbacteria bacterium RIFCSPLOWO2_02_FULL_62_12]
MDKGRKQGVARADRRGHRARRNGRDGHEHAASSIKDKRPGRSQAHRKDSGAVPGAQPVQPLARGARKFFVAHEQHIGRGHEIPVVVIVRIGDGMDVGRDRHAPPSGAVEKRPGEVDVAQRRHRAAIQRFVECVCRIRAFLNVLQIHMDLPPTGGVAQDHGLGGFGETRQHAPILHVFRA